MPALPIALGTVDASALGITWDTDLTALQIAAKATYVANLTASIRTWKDVSAGYGSPLTIANLDLEGAVPAKTFLITIGNDKSAPQPYKELKVSHVDTVARTGYFFFEKNGAEGAHEFGHLLGLADRYFEVYSIASLEIEGGRATAPMARMMFSAPDNVVPAATENPTSTPRYYPVSNLMSNDVANNWTLSRAQLDFIFSGTDEPANRRDVIAIEDTSAAGWETLHLPSPVDGIVLSGNFLYAGPDGIRPLAGYRFKTTGTNKTPVPEVAAPTTAVKAVVSSVRNHQGPGTEKKIKGGKFGDRYKHVSKTHTVRDRGKYIHREQMNIVGKLAK
jgi:hypothetical protein